MTRGYFVEGLFVMPPDAVPGPRLYPPPSPVRPARRCACGYITPQGAEVCPYCGREHVNPHVVQGAVWLKRDGVWRKPEQCRAGGIRSGQVRRVTIAPCKALAFAIIDEGYGPMTKRVQAAARKAGRSTSTVWRWLAERKCSRQAALLKSTLTNLSDGI